MKNKNLINIIEIPKVDDDGFLFFVQSNEQIPFEIKRVYFITKPIKGLPRGKHAHIKTEQVLFCISGKVRMVLDDGSQREEITLSDPKKGIFLDKLVWHEMLDLDEDSILLVLASEKFDRADYIRNYQEFKKYVNKI